MDLKAGGGNNNRLLIDNEQGKLGKLESQVKSNVFGVLFTLLKDHEVSIYLYFVLSIIQFLQFAVFAFHPTIAPVWEADDISDVVYDIFGYFDIVTYIKKTNWNFYITFFYIGFIVVVLAMLTVIYISLVFSTKKASLSIPVMILKNLLLLFTTILFLPIFEYFISITACVSNEQGKSVHSYFSEVMCWNGAHILHAVFSIIGAIIFIAMSLVVSLLFFDYKTSSQDPSSRVTSRPNFILNIYQMILIILLTFLTGDQFQVIILASILFGSIIIFAKFYFNSPYHDEIVAKLWSSITAINLWTAVMVVFSRIMENTLFEGSIIAWLLGCPFIVLVILTNRDNRIDLLLINVNKFQNGSEIQNQIRYILKLMEWQGSNKNAGILLDGYIEIHKQSCNKDDCPLKQKVVKTNRFTKSLMNQDESLDEKHAILLQLCYKMYYHGIKKFPNDNALRISYSFFLLEKMHSKQQALQELTLAEQNRPFLDEQFIIYRYKKIIEEEIAESQNEGQAGLDAITEIAFQNQFRQLQANIEKSALLHMEFWSQLSEDNPDLAKLSDSGSKINNSVQYVEESWVKLLKINPNNMKAMKLYGKYLLEIINDLEAGDLLLEKARAISVGQSNKKALNVLNAMSEESNNEATPTVWVSGEQDKFGVITGINLAAASMFGYNKTELLNRRVNVLMPQLFAKYHDSFLENYLNTGESAIIAKNKDKFVFGKNKSNYAFPVYLSLKAAQSIIQGIQFIATFRVEKNFKSVAYVLTNPDGTIDAITSSCINVLKFDNKSITTKRNLQDYIPGIIYERSKIFSVVNNGKASAQITYSYPKDSEYLKDTEDANIQLSCALNEFVFLNGKENAGFYFKFERVLNKENLNANDRKAKLSNFQFRYEKSKPSILGEYVEGSTSEMNSGTDGENDDMMNVLNKVGDTEPEASARASGMDEEEQEEKKQNFAIGIKTLRLVGGRPQEIEEDKSDGSNSGESEDNGSNVSKNSAQGSQQQQENPQDEDNQEEGSYKDFNTTFKSRKALNSVINDRTPPSTIRNLKYLAHGLSLVLLVIAIVDYVLARTEFNNIEDNASLLDMSNRQTSELLEVAAKIRELSLLGSGVIPTTNLNKTALQAGLTAALDSAKALKESLESQTGSLYSAHYSLLNNPSVNLYDSNGFIESKGLIAAVEEIISRGYALSTQATIPMSDSSYDFITYNMLNNLYQMLLQSSQYYSLELNDKITSKNVSFLLLFLGSIAALVLTIIVAYPIFYQINRSRQEILSLFLDIPEKTVKSLYNKCETFVSNLQVGEEDEILSDIDGDELDRNNEENNSQDFITRKKRKRFKNSAKGQNVFIIQFIIIAMIVEGYFIYNFVSSIVMFNNISVLASEFNSTSAAEPFYSFVNNAERQLFINNTYPVLGSTSYNVAVANIKTMYDLDSSILQKHSINRKLHTDTYTNIFNQVMMVNPCVTLGTDVNQTDCTTFADLTVYQGMTVALTRHFEDLRSLLSCYAILASGNSTTCTVDLPTTVNVPGVTPFQNLTYSLMLTTQANEINKMQFVYIKKSMRILLDSFQGCLSDKFDSALKTRLILFILFIIAIVILYLILWLPMISKINNEIWRTKSMLSMIPLNVIAKIRSIRIYLKRFWNERNLAEY